MSVIKNIKFEFEDDKDTINISGVSVYDDPQDIWLPFTQMFRNWAERRSEFILNFMMDGFNSSTGIYITRITKICEEFAQKKKVEINWYHVEADEDSEFKGETYKDMTKRVKYNIISVQEKTLDNCR